MLNQIVKLIAIFLVVESPLFFQVDTQQTAMSSIDWQFKKTYQTLKSYENRVKSNANSVLNSVNKLIVDVQSDPNVSFTYQTLSAISRLLINIASLNEYQDTWPGRTCNMTNQIGYIGIDNERLGRIKATIDVDASLVNTYAAVLNSAIYTNYYQLNISKRFRGISIKNHMNILTLNLWNYGIMLSSSINYINILYSKWSAATANTCSNCPVTNNFGSSSQALAIIDDTVQNLESSLAGREVTISQMSLNTMNLIKSVLNVTRNVESLFDLTSNLDSCLILVEGFKDMTTNDLWNETSNCADIAWRSSVIEYKKLQYTVMNIEAQYNLSLLTSSSAVTNSYFLATSSILTLNQSSTISTIISNMQYISDTYQKYIVDLGVDYSSLALAENILLSSNTIMTCNCAASNWTTVATTRGAKSTFSPRVTSTRRPITSTSSFATGTRTSQSSTYTDFSSDYTTTNEVTTTDYETTNSTDYGTYSDTQYTEPAANTNSVGVKARTEKPILNNARKNIVKRSLDKCYSGNGEKIPLVDENSENNRTACLVNRTLNQNDAKRYCRIFEMKLFMIDSNQTQTILLQALNFTESFTFYVDGSRNSKDGKWYYEDGKVEAFAELKWKNWNKTIVEDANAMVVTNSDDGTPCIDVINEKNYLNFICE